MSVSPASHLTWHALADVPVPRAGCAVGCVNGAVVVAGGSRWVDGAKVWTDRVDVYDPVGQRWRAGPALPRAGGDAGSVVLDDTLYVVGGGADGDAVETVLRFDGQRWEELLRLPAPVRSPGVAAHGAAVYVLGGLPTAGAYEQATSHVWRATADTPWRECCPMPGPARVNAAVAAVGDRILVAGGCTAAGGGVANLDSVLAYDPAADSWTTVATLPVGVRAASGVELDGRMLVIGGYGDDFLATVFTIDPDSGDVSKAPDLPLAVADARFVRAGAGILGVTGEDGVKSRWAGALEGGITAGGGSPD